MANWVKVTGGPQYYLGMLLEDNGDGTFTAWNGSAFGAIGTTGQLCPGVVVKPLKTKAELAEGADRERFLKRMEDRSQMWYETMKASA